MLHNVRIWPALALALAALLWSRGGPVAADPPDTLREALVGSVVEDGRLHSHAPVVARYVSETGSRFILDRSGVTALLRFERSQEVWALRPSPAPGGGLIYKNDIGQTVLRATRLGGLTLFTSDRPSGAPAALVGEVTATRAPKISPTALIQILASSSARTSRAAERLIPFEAPNVTPGSEFVVADAANVAANTLVRMAALKNGKPFVNRVKKVRIRFAKRMDARFHDGVLDVVIAPDHGIAGRPSSGRLARAVVGQN